MRWSFVLRTVAFVMLTAGVLFGGGPAAAGETSLQIGVPPEVDLGFVPRGETRTLEIPLRNIGPSTTTVRAEVVEVTGEAKRYASVEPPLVTLAPGEAAVARVAIAIPQDFKPRRVVTGINFHQESDAAIAPVGVRVRYRIPGVRLDIVPRDADVGEIAGAAVVIGNYGPDPAEFTLDVVMRGQNGIVRPLLEDVPAQVAPNGVQRLDVLIDTTGLQPGPYQVEAWAKPPPPAQTSGAILAEALQTLFVGVLKGQVLEAGPRLVPGESLMQYRALVRNTGNRPLAVVLTGLLHDAQGHPRGEGVKSVTVPVGDTQEVLLSLPIHAPSLGLSPDALWTVVRGARYTAEATIAVGNQTQQKTDELVIPASGGAKMVAGLGVLFIVGGAVLLIMAVSRLRARRVSGLSFR